MSEISITIPGGTSKRLLTKGKLCDKNIVVTAEGGDGHYDAFWDVYQQNGTRTDYSYAFAGVGWSDETFKPKYDIKPTGSVVRLFDGTSITDLVKLLNDAKCTFDISAVTGATYVVMNTKKLQTLPVLDAQKMANLTYFINGCDDLHTIEKVILKSDGTQTFGNLSFGLLPKLVNITFVGCIGKSFVIKDSPLLSDASVQSIIDCLKDLTGAAAQTLTLHATVGGKLTDAQKAAITAKNWTLVY